MLSQMPVDVRLAGAKNIDGAIDDSDIGPFFYSDSERSPRCPVR